MAIDLNDAPSSGGVQHDREAISRALRALAYKWVPALFPQGRIVRDKHPHVLRVADIKGRAPKEKGSCVINLEGDHAGDWYEFETEKGGGPLSTIKKHFGLDDGQVYGKALEIIEQHDGLHYLTEPAPPATNGSAGQHASDRNVGMANFYWTDGVSAVGTHVETYWRNRKLGDLPPAAHGSIDGSGPDLRFIPFANFKETGEQHSVMIGRFRQPDGTLTGAVHITKLKPDGSHHIGGDYAKITYGPRYDGGLVMLAPIGEAGELGIGEGLETTAAGMFFYGVPGWAAGGTAAMVKFAEWLAAHPGALPLRRLLIFADKGKGGETNARRAAALAQQVVASVELYLPRGDDDLADDLAAGRPPPGPIVEFDPEPAQAVIPALAGTPAESAAQPDVMSAGERHSALSRRIMDIDKATVQSDVIVGLVGDILRADLDPVAEEQCFNQLWRRSGIDKKSLKKIASTIRLETRQGPAQSHPYLSKLAVSESGDPKPIMSNIVTVLREASEMAGAISLNEFTGTINVQRKFPWEPGAGNPCADRPWSDEDELALTEWVQQYVGVHAYRSVIFDAVQRVSYENKFHPVRDYLDSLVWDRVPRLDTASIAFLGCKDTIYNQEVYKRWLISGVARIYNPGVKVDCMTVLVGDQGMGKSSSMRLLFDPFDQGWFTDQLSEIGTKDASLELRGIWCAEYADLEGMSRAESRTIKSFMSRTTERFRPPYGRVPVMIKRQCVFGATTNEDEFLKDATGNRRFWPISTGKIAFDVIIKWRDQIWAEAVQAYRDKAKHWIDEQTEPDLAAAAAGEADRHLQSDAWEGVIRRWLTFNGKTNATTDELLRDAIEAHDKTKWTRSEQIRVGFIMRKLKWTRVRDADGAREWRYWKPGLEPKE